MALKTGDKVTDPETGTEYTYRPDENEEAPFENGGEYYTLAGVDEEPVEPESFADEDVPDIDLDDEDFEPEISELGWDPYAGDYVDDEPMDYWDAPYDE